MWHQLPSLYHVSKPVVLTEVDSCPPASGRTLGSALRHFWLAQLSGGVLLLGPSGERPGMLQTSYIFACDSQCS